MRLQKAFLKFRETKKRILIKAYVAHITLYLFKMCGSEWKTNSENISAEKQLGTRTWKSTSKILFDVKVELQFPCKFRYVYVENKFQMHFYKNDFQVAFCWGILGVCFLCSATHMQILNTYHCSFLSLFFAMHWVPGYIVNLWKSCAFLHFVSSFVENHNGSQFRVMLISHIINATCDKINIVATKSETQVAYQKFGYKILCRYLIRTKLLT